MSCASSYRFAFLERAVDFDLPCEELLPAFSELWPDEFDCSWVVPLLVFFFDSQYCRELTSGASGRGFPVISENK